MYGGVSVKVSQMFPLWFFRESTIRPQTTVFEIAWHEIWKLHEIIKVCAELALGGLSHYYLLSLRFTGMSNH